MRKFTFKDYCEALQEVGPLAREDILAQAKQDKTIGFPEYIQLCRMANSI